MHNHVQVKIPSAAVADRGNVRIGALSPSLPRVHATPVSVKDSETVSPAMPPVRVVSAPIQDAGMVRLGALSPTMRPR